MVLIDLQKTFDTSDHNILIKKCLFWVLLMRQSSGAHHIFQIGSLLSVWKMQIRIKTIEEYLNRDFLTWLMGL